MTPGRAEAQEGEGRRGHPHGRRPWHPVLTAGPQQLVQDGQRVQAYLENEVGEEEEDAGPQQSFEEADSVTCETRAPHYPSPGVTPRSTSIPSNPGRSWEGVHCGHAKRRQGSAPETGSHQDLACLTVRPAQPKNTLSTAFLGKLRHGAMQGARAPEPHSLPPSLAPAAPSDPAGTARFPAPLQRDQHRDAAHHSHPNPWWNALRGRLRVGARGSPAPRAPSNLPPAAAVPPSHPAPWAARPFSWPRRRQ